MKLNEYLSEYGIPFAVFARKIDVSVSTLTNILEGRTDIRLSTALRIEEVTKGHVKCEDLAAESQKKAKRTAQAKQADQENEEESHHRNDSDETEV